MAIQSLGFYGFGNLAMRLFDGFSSYLSSNKIDTYYTNLVPVNSKIDSLTYVSPKQLLSQCDVVIVAVKPQQLSDILPQLSQADWSNRCLVSVLAGIHLSTYTQSLSPLPHACRVMPNTSAEFQQSMTVYSCLQSTAPEFDTFIHSLFSCVGTILSVNEEQMDLCTAVCGSGPAFFYMIIQKLYHHLILKGFSSTESRIMVNQLVKGVSTSINRRPDSLDTLIREIKSPNGTTAAGLNQLIDSDLLDDWVSVFEASEERSQSLSKQFNQSTKD